MTFHKMILIFLFSGTLFLIHNTSIAVPPDFNADRRVNIKCPSTVEREHEGQLETDGFMSTLKRLYHELDENLKASDTNGQGWDGYSFSDDPDIGKFYVIHAKATFPSTGLGSLFPQEKINFQEVFYLSEIDWGDKKIAIVRQRDKKRFTINVSDFEKAFVWYNALLDKKRAYIPIYGFLSLPGEADAFPTIWDGWEGNKSDTALPPESLVDYDFYKILDYQDGYYLLAKDFYEFDYRDNIDDFGIIGWIDKAYITLWRSRLYYHPMKPAQFFDNESARKRSAETDEINRFYVEHGYLQERLFMDIVEKLDQESLHKFYVHFGFPQLKPPETSLENNTTEIFIPGAFTPRLMRLLSGSMKRNLNTFFLFDVSESMRPFADYVHSFNRAVNGMRQEGVGLRVNRIYTYSDSSSSDRDVSAEPDFIRVRGAESLSYAHDSLDHNYTEPLIRSFNKVLDEIGKLEKERVILPLQEKLLFIITDAGPNDLTDELLELTAGKAQKLNLRIYLIYPSASGVKIANAALDDTPGKAYRALETLIQKYETRDSADSDINFRKVKFQADNLLSEEGRKKDFSEQHDRLLGAIKAYTDFVFSGSGEEALPKDIILYFSDEKLLTEMRKWRDRKIQVLNHVVKYIKDADDPLAWEERIAIPAKPVEAFLRAIRTQDDVSLSDLKKLVIVNSLVSVDDIDKCRKLYDHIKPLIEKKTFKSADDVFYKALTMREPLSDTSWNKALAEAKGPLGEYIANRGFHLNSFNQAVQRKFMYLRINELYDSGE